MAAERSRNECGNIVNGLLGLLQGIAKAKTSRWRQNLENCLDSATIRDRHEAIVCIYNRVFEGYQNADDSRWYDPYHTLFSTGFALRLIGAESGRVRDIELILPAILLHDIGYYAVQDKTQWSGRNSRIIHMQEGAARAAGVLCECAKGFGPEEIERIGGRDFGPEAIERIVGMIAVHDNPYLGIPIGDDPLRQALRDCDRVWVMHALSFYKDWVHKAKDYPGDSGIADFLCDRAVQFYGDPFPECLQKRFGQPSADLVEKNRSRIEPPHFDAAEALIDKLFQRRIDEIDKINDVCLQSASTDLRKHKEYLEERINGDFDLLETL